MMNFAAAEHLEREAGGDDSAVFHRRDADRQPCVPETAARGRPPGDAGVARQADWEIPLGQRLGAGEAR